MQPAQNSVLRQDPVPSHMLPVVQRNKGAGDLALSDDGGENAAECSQATPDSVSMNSRRD